MATDPLPRWAYRFDNFSRAFLLLREAMEKDMEVGLTQLEQEGAIQRFEYCWELAWKMLADDLEADGVIIQPKTPRQTIRAAATAGLLADPEVWMAALDARNKLSHVYDFSVFARVMAQIKSSFLAMFDGLHEHYQERRMAAGGG